jgi:hypothetical protein
MNEMNEDVVKLLIEIRDTLKEGFALSKNSQEELRLEWKAHANRSFDAQEDAMRVHTQQEIKALWLNAVYILLYVAIVFTLFRIGTVMSLPH